MKRFFAAVLLLMGVFPLYAQHINSRDDTELAREIMQDTAFEQYVWAVGFGDDLETADSSALAKLSSSDLNLVTQYNSQTRNEQINIESAKTTDIDEIKITGASMVYLENIRRIELFNYEYNGTTFPYFVLRYVTAEQWSKRHDGLKDKINKYLDYAEYSVNVTEQLRCYVWALALLKQYNKGDIKVNNMAADQYAMSKITEILDDIEISVTAIREQKGDKNYPYTLYLDFIYEGEPISNLSFRYYDGCGYIDDSIKDGRSMISMKKHNY